MIFEYAVMLVAAIFVMIMLSSNVYRYVKKHRSPLAQAERRFRIANAEAKAAALNKQTEDIYDNLYKDTLNERKQ